jgi:hypothetical protein
MGPNVFFLKIDFEIVYDHVEWPFILSMLKALGFGSSFASVVETLFVKASKCPSINRFQSERIGLFRSIQQGCPLDLAL